MRGSASGATAPSVSSYGVFPVILSSEIVSSMHGDAEFLPVDAVGPAIEILFGALTGREDNRGGGAP